MCEALGAVCRCSPETWGRADSEASAGPAFALEYALAASCRDFNFNEGMAEVGRLIVT